MSKKYSLEIHSPSGHVAIMTHKGKTKFCKRTANKYWNEWVFLHGWHVNIIEADSFAGE